MIDAWGVTLEIGPYSWLVKIDSGNGLVPSGNKPLPGSMLIQIYVSTLRRCRYLKSSLKEDKDLFILHIQYHFCWRCGHDDVIKWKHLLALCSGNSYSPHKGQCRRALFFSLICTWINGWVNNREAGDLRWHCAHYDVIVINGYKRNWGICSHSTNLVLMELSASMCCKNR